MAPVNRSDRDDVNDSSPHAPDKRKPTPCCGGPAHQWEGMYPRHQSASAGESEPATAKR